MNVAVAQVRLKLRRRPSVWNVYPNDEKFTFNKQNPPHQKNFFPQ